MQRAESSSWGAQATRPTAGSVRRTDALGNEEGESGLPLAAQPATRRKRCARRALTGATSNSNLSGALAGAGRPTPANDSYLVDSASSHMLVSKIKPCMSKYKQLYSETANGSLYKLSFI